MQEEIVTDTDEEYTMALININEEELINNSIEIRENVKDKLEDGFNSNILIEVEEVLALERSPESDIENAEEDFNINVLIEVQEQDLAQEKIPESDLENVEEELSLQSLVNQDNQNLSGTSTSYEEKVLKRKFVHRPLSEIVFNSIRQLNKRGSVTLMEIISKIEEDNVIDIKYRIPQISKVLEVSVENGILENTDCPAGEARYKKNKVRIKESDDEMRKDRCDSM